MDVAGTPAASAPAATGAAVPAGAPAGADPAAGGTAGAQANQAGQPGTPAAPGTTDPNGQPAGTSQEQFTERERAFLTALQEERGKRQEFETQVAEFQRGQGQFRGQQAPQGQNPGQPAPHADPFSEIGDDDILTGGQFKSLLQTGIMPMFQQLATTLTMLQRGQQHPDMNEAVTTYLPQVIQSDPAVGQALQQVQGSARMILAHVIGSLAKKALGGNGQQQQPSIQGGGAPDLNTLAAQILANIQKPGAAGAAPGSAIVNMADQLRGMTDVQFRQYLEDQKRMMSEQGR